MNRNFDSISDDPCGPGSDCAKILEIVDRYIDGCADEKESSFIASHTDGCTDCKEGVLFEEKFRARIMAVQPECMPQDFKEKLLMSLGFPGMNDMHASIPGSSEHVKHSFFKFFRKNGHTSRD